MTCPAARRHQRKIRRFQNRSPFQERVTETESLLSGARVLTMAQVGPVRFSKQGVTLTLSDTALDALSLHADSVFYIELFPTEDGFSLTVEVDGRGISDFSGL